MARYIDRLPPDGQAGPREICEYLFYLREQMNVILSLIYKKEETADGDEA